MAPRKKPGTIFKRDHTFTQTIGKPAPDKPNAFAIVFEDFQARLEAERPAETPEPRSVDATPAAEPRQSEEVPAPDLPFTELLPEAPELRTARATTTTSETMEADSVEDRATPEATPEGLENSAAARPAEAAPEAGRAGDATEPVELIVSMLVPRDLVERAAKWGAAAHQSGPTVLRHALKKMKPVLLAELKTIRTGDVHQDRAESVGYRLQSRLRFSPAEFADMKARLDPEGFGILTSMVNHYARNRFAAFLDKLMAGAGY